MTDDPNALDDPAGALHRPDKEWRCTDDGEQWPCMVFKRRMWTWYHRDRPRLAAIMRVHRDNALAGLADLTPEQADVRFVGWVDKPPVRRRKRSI